MSHQPERKEKDCLNCGTLVLGRYCHLCGQENIVTHQSFWALVKHFVYDVLHFDGKFFITLKYIFTRPGYAARQYAEGRRMTFLDPIRMYLFTSAVFFLVFFSVEAVRVGEGSLKGSLDNDDRVELAQYYQEKMQAGTADTSLAARVRLLLDTNGHKNINIDSLGWREDLMRSLKINGRRYNSVAEYDSVQKKLPEAARDNWLTGLGVRKTIKANLKYGSSEAGFRALLSEFLHKMPYLLFVSLPFFAGILKLLYIRRKNFFYSDHAVFTLYHYIFSFLLLLLLFGISTLNDRLRWSFLEILMGLVTLAWPVYLFIEMKNFYRQSKRKTFVKFALLNIAGSVVMLILFTLFLTISFLQS